MIDPASNGCKDTRHIQCSKPKATRALSDEVLELVRLRDAARAGRDWKRSDEIRDLLKAQGFEVRDTPKGTELV